jgi:hypothetical protein
VRSPTRFEFDGQAIRSFRNERERGLLVRLDTQYVRLDRGGVVVERHRALITSNVRPYLPAPDGSGGIVEYTSEFTTSDSGRGSFVVQPIRAMRDGSVFDRLPPLSLEIDLVPGTRIPPPMNSRIVFVQDRDALWFASSSEYRIMRRTLAGDTTLVITMQADPAVISHDEKVRLAADWSSNHNIRPDHVPAVLRCLERTATGHVGHLRAVDGTRRNGSRQ